MRLLLICALCLGLVACGQTTPSATGEKISSYFNGLFNKQAQEEAQQKCAKAAELRIGMTNQEVANACGRSALQVIANQQRLPARTQMLLHGSIVFLAACRTLQPHNVGRGIHRRKSLAHHHDGPY